MTEGADIETALTDVSNALSAGELAAAAAAVETLVARLAAAAGTRLSADQLARLSQLLGRCNQLAAATQGRLTESLLQFGNGSRAQRAYGDR